MKFIKLLTIIYDISDIQTSHFIYTYQQALVIYFVVVFAVCPYTFIWIDPRCLLLKRERVSRIIGERCRSGPRNVPESNLGRSDPQQTSEGAAHIYTFKNLNKVSYSVF